MNFKFQFEFPSEVVQYAYFKESTVSYQDTSRDCLIDVLLRLYLFA